jgi:hypothetical protein
MRNLLKIQKGKYLMLLEVWMASVLWYCNSAEETITEVREKLESSFVLFLKEQHEEYLPGVDMESDTANYDLVDLAANYLKSMVRLLPKQCAPSGSYPDELYFVYTVICTAYGMEWDIPDADGSAAGDNDSARSDSDGGEER